MKLGNHRAAFSSLYFPSCAELRPSRLLWESSTQRQLSANCYSPLMLAALNPETLYSNSPFSQQFPISVIAPSLQCLAVLRTHPTSPADEFHWHLSSGLSCTFHIILSSTLCKAIFHLCFLLGTLSICYHFLWTKCWSLSLSVLLRHPSKRLQLPSQRPCRDFSLSPLFFPLILPPPTIFPPK